MLAKSEPARKNIKKKGIDKYIKKNESLRRKEIVYTAEEWKQIEDKAAKCHLKTATFIRVMSLNGDVYVVDLKELAPLLNGMRIISNNVNRSPVKRTKQIAFMPRTLIFCGKR